MNGNGKGGERFFGKYRGTVLNNVDPLGVGRLLVEVPDVLTLVPSSWAQPCVPLAGPTGTPMGVYLMPPIGAGVWVEFEKGDPTYPIWVGCRWGSSSDVPSLVLLGLPASPSIVLQTAGQNAIAISDAPGAAGGIMLKCQSGAMILVNNIGITISSGTGTLVVSGDSITVSGSPVTVNEGALVVT
jgi:uncharacterized protein involved in type VI secretion and phage assembly